MTEVQYARKSCRGRSPESPSAAKMLLCRRQPIARERCVLLLANLRQTTTIAIECSETPIAMMGMTSVPWIHYSPRRCGQNGYSAGVPQCCKDRLCRIFTTALTQLIRDVYDSDWLIASANTDWSLQLTWRDAGVDTSSGMRFCTHTHMYIYMCVCLYSRLIALTQFSTSQL